MESDVYDMLKRGEYASMQKDCTDKVEVTQSDLHFEDGKECPETMTKWLNCTICGKIPLNADIKKCTKCDQLYCDKCYEANKDKACANKKCGDKEFKVSRPSRLVRNFLSNLQFKHKCFLDQEEQSFNYQQLVKHLNTDCPATKGFKCCEGCDNKEQMTQNGLTHHLINDCEMVKLHCKFCETSYLRSEFNDEEKHPCAKNMLLLSKNLKKDFDDLEAKNKVFKEEFNANKEKLEEFKKECREIENKYYAESDKLRQIKKELNIARVDAFQKNIVAKS